MNLPNSPANIPFPPRIGRYEVAGLCSDKGGMGALLFVKNGEGRAVLKFCKLTDPEMTARFRREVKLMQMFSGNSYVMQIIDADLDHTPPYFVMPYYEHGDLLSHADEFRSNHAFLEYCFTRMIDCLAQLHDRGVYHRDIKPQNFLVDSGSLVISDLGLCTESEESTGFTRSSMWAGTQGYLPPEYFAPGGFKNSSVASDIFMLGKSFYVILSGRDPMYVSADGVPAQLYPIIERCCNQKMAHRYQTLASLKQSLKSAFDVLLGRAVGSESAYALMRSITDMLETSNQFNQETVNEYIDAVILLDRADQHRLAMEMREGMFKVFGIMPDQSRIPHFLAAYRDMVESGNFGFSFAETIAKNMSQIFVGQSPSAADKTESLRVAIIGAVNQNRFAAMDTCRALIMGVMTPELGQRVHDMLLDEEPYFVTTMDPSACSSPSIRAAITTLKANAEAEAARHNPSTPF